MALKVRRLKRDDAALAVGVVKAFARRDVSLAYMERFLANEANHLIVAEVDNALAGFLLAHSLDRLKEEARKLFIYEIEVAEGHRRQGIGSVLIEHALGIAREEQMLSAFVFTNYANAGAVEFYKRTGARVATGDNLLFVYSA
jgi:aminoglycoside 3-N-acetyltransferase I